MVGVMFGSGIGKPARPSAAWRGALGLGVSALALAAGGAAMAQQTYADGDNNTSGIPLNAPSTTFSVPAGATATQSGAIADGTGTAIEKIGGGTLIVSGTNTYSGGTTLTAGTLVITNAASLGTGTLNGAGGTLSNVGNVTFANAITAQAGATTTIVAADGTTLTRSAGASYVHGAGSVVILGAAGSTGTIVFGSGSYTPSTPGTTRILGGTVVMNTASALGIGGAHTVDVAAGATLSGSLISIGTLTGAGDVTGSVDIQTGGSFSGRIGLAGGNPAQRVTFLGSGTLTLTGDNRYGGGTFLYSGRIEAAAGSLGTGDIEFFNLAGGFTRRLVTSGTLSGRTITVNGGAASAIAAPAGQTARLALNSFVTNQTGRLEFGEAGIDGTVVFATPTVTIGNAARTLVFAGGTTRDEGGLGLLINGLASTTINSGATLTFAGGGSTAITRALTNNGTLRIDRSEAMTFSGAIGGTGGLVKAGTGTTTLSAANSYTGATTIDGGSLRGGAANTFSNASATTVNAGGTLDLGGVAQSIASVRLAGGTLTNGALTGAVTSTGGAISGLSGPASVTILSGTTTVTGTNAYTGATAVNGGTLVVEGSITASSGLTVAAGATLGGSGQLPSTTVSGAISPGNSPGTLTVNGNLTFNSGSTYVAEVQGAVADRLVVTGAAALAGTLRLVPLGGTYVFATPYTLLSAAGGASGAFATVETQGSFGAGVTTRVDYTATQVRLTLVPAPLAPIVAAQTPIVAAPTQILSTPSAGRGNAYAVALGIDRAVAGGAIPSALFPIYDLPAQAIPAAVNQLSGEAHSAAPALAVSAADQFLRAMLDPLAAGRLAPDGTGPGEAAFSALVRKGHDLPSARPVFLDAPRYSVWGAGFGSQAHNEGSARIGSAKRELSDGHLAVGADVLIAPRTVVGFALSGGAARASLGGGLGTVDAEAYQAGLYGATRLGPLNLGAALSYGRLEHDVRRAIPVLGTGGLAASYATNAWSGRLQASVEIVGWNGLSVSPLAALQTVHVRSPAVREASHTGPAAGALTLARRSDVTARSELGVQIDVTSAVAGLPVTGYVRAGWAHYYRRDASVSATITGLAGSSFAVEGAKPARNAALVAAGLDLRIGKNVTLGARFDGELSGPANRYGGSAQLRVSF